jgi:hypothetical protein
MYVTTIQERQLAACRDFYPTRDFSPFHQVVEVDDPLFTNADSKTRILGPFDVETLGWMVEMKAKYPEFRAIFGYDADGKQYVEF